MQYSNNDPKAHS